jgi:hypothetical protein
MDLEREEGETDDVEILKMSTKIKKFGSRESSTNFFLSQHRSTPYIGRE